ncbi:hypothetical protein [Methanocaldococcus sp.]
MDEILEKIVKGEIKDKEILMMYKEYIKIRDEISYLENLLEDFDILCERVKSMKDDLRGLKLLIPKISKYADIPNYNEILRMLDSVENIDLNDLYDVKYDYIRKLEDLKAKLKRIEENLREKLGRDGDNRNS